MPLLSLGVVGTSRKRDEHRLPIDPRHLGRIDGDLRRRIFLERGYGRRFGVSDAQLAPDVGGLRSRSELFEDCDVIVLPKPLPEDLAALPRGKVVWGWPHCVQDEAMTDVAIERRLTLIAGEAMNHWTRRGISASTSSTRTTSRRGTAPCSTRWGWWARRGPTAGACARR